MEHYVTLFDSLFIPQGLSLHESLEKFAGDYTLWIICPDSSTYDIISKLNLLNVNLILLSEVETSELKIAKQNRSKVEYYYTLTPFTFKFVFETNKDIKRVTYLDADLWFRKSPKPIFKELDKSLKYVLITEHAYAPKFDNFASVGKFCVQFITFTRDKGEIVRKWWEDKCIELCSSNTGGDQKYLDDWDDRFENIVHVLSNPEFCLGPWNSTRFPYSNGIFYHFHGLRIIKNNNILLDRNPLPKPLIVNVYIPYIKSLKYHVKKLEEIGIIQQPQIKNQGLLRTTYKIWRLKFLIFKI